MELIFRLACFEALPAAGAHFQFQLRSIYRIEIRIVLSGMGKRSAIICKCNGLKYIMNKILKQMVSLSIAEIIDEECTWTLSTACSSNNWRAALRYIGDKGLKKNITYRQAAAYYVIIDRNKKNTINTVWQQNFASFYGPGRYRVSFGFSYSIALCGIFCTTLFEQKAEAQ